MSFFTREKREKNREREKETPPLSPYLQAGSRSLTATMSCSAALCTQGHAASTLSNTSMSSVASSVASDRRLARTNASERAKPGCERIEA